MVRKLLTSLLLLLVTSQAFAQVTYVTRYEGKDETGTGGTPFTLSSVNNTGGNLMTCDVVWRNSASQTLNSITFNSNAFTSNEIGSQVNSSGGSSRSFYYNGTMATANVVVTMSATVNAIQVACQVYSGAGSIGNVATNTGTNTLTGTAANTGADANDLIQDVLFVRVTPGTISQGADQTMRAVQSTAGTITLNTSTQPGTASDDTMSYSWTNSQAYGHKAYVIEEPGAGGGNAPRAEHYKRLMGHAAANDDEFLLRASR